MLLICTKYTVGPIFIFQPLTTTPLENSIPAVKREKNGTYLESRIEMSAIFKAVNKPLIGYAWHRI